jgi:hypothetical protein
MNFSIDSIITYQTIYPIQIPHNLLISSLPCLPAGRFPLSLLGRDMLKDMFNLNGHSFSGAIVEKTGRQINDGIVKSKFSPPPAGGD